MQDGFSILKKRVKGESYGSGNGFARPQSPIGGPVFPHLIGFVKHTVLASQGYRIFPGCIQDDSRRKAWIGPREGCGFEPVAVGHGHGRDPVRILKRQIFGFTRISRQVVQLEIGFSLKALRMERTGVNQFPIPVNVGKATVQTGHSAVGLEKETSVFRDLCLPQQRRPDRGSIDCQVWWKGY